MGVALPGRQATDVLLFVFHTDEDDEPTELVTYTQHKVGEVSERKNYLSLQCITLLSKLGGIV